MSNQYQYIINSLKSQDYDFENLAIEIFHYQRLHNPVYKRFLEIIGCQSKTINYISAIPFCPISLFKSLLIQTESWNPQATFLSSGTGGNRSRHAVRSLARYHQNCRNIFESVYGPVSDYHIISLLPNYYANPSSSLLSMVHSFMKITGGGQKDFFLDNYEKLASRLLENRELDKKTMLFGVSFALLDYIRQYEHTDMTNLIVIETGGMKKHGNEVTRKDLHEQLAKGFGHASIHSEYGMTECMSQLYQTEKAGFRINRVMKILISEHADPLKWADMNTKGQVNIIDLANIDTLSFIKTDDLGVVRDTEHINILGRLDHSDLRGCNYLI